MKHKYKVGDRLWCGNVMVKVLRRLDNNEYQVSFSGWTGDNIAVLKEFDLSLVPNDDIRLASTTKTITIKAGHKIVTEEREMMV